MVFLILQNRLFSPRWRALGALLFVLVFAAGCSGKVSIGGGDADGGPPLPPFTGQTGTILFVTQVPVEAFTVVTSVFGNHGGSIDAAPRGGDLMIRYPDGTVRNLTREAGFGMTGLQGDNAIAVREPCVHFSGNRALFSMVIGAPKHFGSGTYRWQIYEVTGLAAGETVAITRVPNQPADFNNVAPIYASNDRVIFASDRPRNGEAYLYPQLDEYESAATTTGLWSLDPVSGDLVMIEHAPSGVFSPSLDSFGRVIFTKWDHLQRDQQADADRTTPGRYGAFTYADESEAAMRIADLDGMEIFPEAHEGNDPDADPNVSLHAFNQFLPWEVNEDGSAEETLNHVGRHELGGSYLEGSFKNDPNLTNRIPDSIHVNRYPVTGDGGILHMREDPRTPGTFYGTYAREFGTASGGELIRFTGAPTLNAEQMEVVGVTDGGGLYRNPLPMSDGTLIASHSVVGGTNARFDYRLVALTQQGATWQAGGALTAGITADVSWYDPDVLRTYSGPLWELDPVEVAPRPRPTPRVQVIEAPELTVFSETGVDVDALRAWMRDNQVALIISRNVTRRDRADLQQPFNLRIPGGVEAIAKPGTVYDIAFFQIFEGDAVRGYGGADSPSRGRRLLARPMHGPAISATPAGGPLGSVALGLDGSMAAFVPARRALTWQTASPIGTPVVRERNWVSFQAGEIRTCAVCHGLNTKDQLGAAVPTNPPEALRALLTAWKATQP